MATTMSPGQVPLWTMADRLRKARDHAHMKQSELAQTIGIARSSIVAYEAGSTVPRRPVLLSWAMATGVPVEWLIEGVEPAGGPNTPSDLPDPSFGWTAPSPVCRARVIQMRRGATTTTTAA